MQKMKKKNIVSKIRDEWTEAISKLQFRQVEEAKQKDLKEYRQVERLRYDSWKIEKEMLAKFQIICITFMFIGGLLRNISIILAGAITGIYIGFLTNKMNKKLKERKEELERRLYPWR